MNRLYETYRDQGFEFFAIYAREPHPGEHYPHHTDMGQKVAYARTCRAEDGIRYPLLVDDLQGTVHQAYGNRPNAVYIIDPNGVIVYRAMWVIPAEIEEMIQALLSADAARRAGRRIKPTFSEKTYFITDELPANLRDQVLGRAGTRSQREWDEVFGS